MKSSVSPCPASGCPSPLHRGGRITRTTPSRPSDAAAAPCRVKVRFENIIRTAQDSICAAVSEMDGTPFHEDAWTREDGGGGISRVLQDGNVWEKAGVNVSVVYGSMPATAYRAATERDVEIPADASRVPFFAAGISSVMHPRNPHAPTMHFNYRCACCALWLLAWRGPAGRWVLVVGAALRGARRLASANTRLRRWSAECASARSTQGVRVPKQRTPKCMLRRRASPSAPHGLRPFHRHVALCRPHTGALCGQACDIAACRARSGAHARLTPHAARVQVLPDRRVGGRAAAVVVRRRHGHHAGVRLRRGHEALPRHVQAGLRQPRPGVLPPLPQVVCPRAAAPPLAISVPCQTPRRLL